ncbi:hypothetical protein, partial [Vibrio sp. Vb2424]|uniref:hypothetical protein n=1 Tax=Vibrio sp. Vb2424 TaxID=2816074 RepID=UPI001A8FD69D
FRYDLAVQSTADLTALSSIFPLGTALKGSAGFQGSISGEGEKYTIRGKADSGELSAEGVYLKGLNISAPASGVNAAYEANGTAIAE